MNLFISVLSGALALSLLSGCQSQKPPANPSPVKAENPPTDSETTIQTTDDAWKKDFPAHWWQEVPRKEAKSWEVLPQDAGYKEVVLSKRNELGILSNFSETPFVFRGVCYPNIEAFWQMMKYPEKEEDPRWQWTAKWRYTRQQVSQMEGFAAKSAGSYANSLMDKNNANWVTFEGRRVRFYSAKPAEHYELIWNALIEKVRQNPEVLNILMSTGDLKLLADHEISAKSPREWHYYLLWMDIRDLIAKKELSLQSAEDLSLRTCRSQR